ncbi:MAG: T9SS type A sorting domain-containing protein [Bacteroidales bacterium]|nr:T9SS type A sorting domain-containing protein [Bacteroidales bacterium]
MKNKTLPFGFLALIIGFTVFFLSSTSIDTKENNTDNAKIQENKRGIKQATKYLAKIRNNQITGKIDPKDVLKAREQINANSFKSGSSIDIEWKEMGPDNIGGRTRAILFDNRDSEHKTIYTAGVNGGIFKSTNLGATWHKINTSNGTANLNVTCITQTPNGTIYVGTGEGFLISGYTQLSDFGFNEGFIGHGIFKSTSNDNFELVDGTQPTINNDTVEWAFINELAFSSDNKIWTATNKGLKMKETGGWSTASYSDSTGSHLLSGNCLDVKVGSNGIVVASVNNKCYISTNGNINNFICHSTADTFNLPNDVEGRTEFAIAPSNPDIIYASVVEGIQNPSSLYGIYRSTDKGVHWSVIFPGESTINIFNEQGYYNNTLVVFPNDPDKVLLGGIDMWEGKKISNEGYFQWTQKSNGSDISIYAPVYLHNDHHTYIFRPGYDNTFFTGTDGGIAKATIEGGNYSFQAFNKNYNITQFYTVAYSNDLKQVMGGAQDNGTLYISGEGNTVMNAREVWFNEISGFEDGGDGGYCAISLINPYAFIYSKEPDPEASTTEVALRMRRSESQGIDFSSKFLINDIDNRNFITPLILWESINDQNSRDSVNFLADKNYEANENVVVFSNNFYRPFDYTLPVALTAGDSIKVKDIVSTKLFIATTDNIWMTKQVLDFAVDPEWFLISDDNHTNFDGDPQCIAYSQDANYLFIGTQQGKLFRIANIALAYDYDRADVRSPSCIIATDELTITQGGITQVITSVAVDPNDANKVIITLGNYGNTDYVYYTENALDVEPTFTCVQGNLPQMPVYSSLIEMTQGSKLVLVGTEEGIWATEDITSGQWVEHNGDIGKVPVFALKQQTTFIKSFTISFIDPGSGQTIYITWPETTNYGAIYCGTYGRGIFIDTTYITVGINDPVEIVSNKTDIKVYPNPVNNNANVSFSLETSTNVIINIYDLNGRIVKSINLNKKERGTHNIPLELNSLTRGTYLLQMIAGENTCSTKFVVIK